MKIAITANSAWNLLNFRLSLIMQLMDEGHEVIAIAPSDGAEDKIVEKTGIKFIKLNSLSRKGSNPYQDIKLIREYRTIYKENKIDIAIQYTIKPNIYGSLAGGRTKTKTISNLTGLGYLFLSDSIKSKVAKKLYKLALRKTSFACFHNQIDANLFQKLRLVSRDKIKVINGSGVDTTYYQAKSKPGTANFVFLYIGRLLYDKGIRELLAAFKEINDARLDITLHLLGDIDAGNDASLTNEELKGYKENLNLVHHGMQADVRPFIANADCVVLPSYREGLPKSLLEAMSMQRPFITVDSPGCGHLVENERNGFLAKVKNIASLRDQMLRMVNLTESERFKMGQEGRKIVLEKYSCENINNEYIKLISQLGA